MISADSNNTAKNILKSLIKKIFSIETSEFYENTDYSNLLDICKNIKNVNLKDKLLFILYENIFLQGNKLKKQVSDIDIKCFQICIEKNNSDKDNKYFLEYISEESDIFNIFFPKKKGWTTEIINLISFIMKVKKDFSILFECVELVMSFNDKYYVPHLYNNDFSNKNFEELLDSFYNYFMSISHETERNKNYSIIYRDNNFIEYNCTNDEMAQYLNKKDYDIKILKEFIYNNSDIKNKNKKCSTIIKDNDNKLQNNNNQNEKCLNKRVDDDILKNNNKNKKIDSVKLTILGNNNKNNEFEEIIKNLKNEIKNDYDEKFKKQKDDYDEKFKKQKDDYDEKFKKQKEDYEEKIKKQKNEIDSLNNTTNQIKENNLNLKAQINHLKVEMKKELNNKEENLKKEFNNKEENMNQNIEKLKDELDIIKCRGLVKSIIDFVYSVFYEININKNYEEKKNAILNQIAIYETYDNMNKSLLEQLYDFIEKIFIKKKEGDKKSHEILELKKLFEQIKGNEDIKNVFAKLKLDNYIVAMNNLYKQNDSILSDNNLIYLIQNKKEEFLNNIKIKK